MSDTTKLRLTITRVDGAVFEGEVDAVTVPGSEGEMTILPNHAPLISALQKGTITVSIGGESEEFEVEKGTIEISNNNATALL